MEIKNKINQLYNELVQIRRDFHMHPELGMQESRTSNKICEYLDQWGIKYTQGIGNTGVVGIIEGTNSNKTIALRADIDALPIQEESNAPYKSTIDGKMHACGHDAHTSILLGTAKILNDMKDELSGTIKLFFQPAEETCGGALPMIKDGCMENPKVDYVLGLHVMPYLETGKVELKYGKLNAASDTINIKIKGKSGHGAYPEQGTDAIVIAGNVVVALQSIVSRNISPLNSLVISLGTINGGIRGNVTADTVTMTGTLRSLDQDTRIYAKQRIKEVVENISLSLGGIGEVDFEEGYEPLINDNEVVDILKDTCEKVIGKDNIVYKDAPSLGVEDFSYFSNRAKGAFYHLGCRNSEKGITAPLHNCKFDIDEECLKTGVLLQVSNTIALLNK